MHVINFSFLTKQSMRSKMLGLDIYSISICLLHTQTVKLCVITKISIKFLEILE